MNKEHKIYIAGHNGMVGSAIWRKLIAQGYNNLVGRSSTELDLRDQKQVSKFFQSVRPDYVFLAAAKVGGIVANNNYRAEFIYDNLAIQNNIIHESYINKVQKLLFLGSSCIYPKLASQPMNESLLLTGPLESTNEPYAVAKIAGLKMCDAYRDQYGCNFISVMPTNLYGPNDNYDLESSHVIPALIRKFMQAKQRKLSSVSIWGSGNPKREFLHVDDMADACIFLMSDYNEPGFVNVGTGKEISIKGLASLIKKIVGFQGQLEFDIAKPDGTPRKLLDVAKLTRLGWEYRISLEDGLKRTIDELNSTGQCERWAD